MKLKEKALLSLALLLSSSLSFAQFPVYCPSGDVLNESPRTPPPNSVVTLPSTLGTVGYLSTIPLPIPSIKFERASINKQGRLNCNYESAAGSAFIFLGSPRRASPFTSVTGNLWKISSGSFSSDTCESPNPEACPFTISAP